MPRMVLQQALNAAARDNFVPLARIVSAASAADPDTGGFVPDPAWSDALYYAVQCSDHDVVPEGSTGREQLDLWLDAAEAGVADLRLDDTVYAGLPCLFWPDGGAVATRPEPPVDPPYPVLLLSADTDPNTPVRNAEQVFERTGDDDAALLLLLGGPHVIFDRGDSCVDGAVVGVVTAGRLPMPRQTTCPGFIADSYWPLPPPTAAGYTDPWETVYAVLGAVLDNPLYAAWGGPDHLVVGCDEGGTARYLISADETVHVWLEACEWTDGVPVDGYISVTENGNGDARATLALPFAQLSMDWDGYVSGEFRGQLRRLSRRAQRGRRIRTGPRAVATSTTSPPWVTSAAPVAASRPAAARAAGISSRQPSGSTARAASDGQTEASGRRRSSRSPMARSSRRSTSSIRPGCVPPPAAASRSTSPG